MCPLWVAFCLPAASVCWRSHSRLKPKWHGVGPRWPPPATLEQPRLCRQIPPPWPCSARISRNSSHSNLPSHCCPLSPFSSLQPQAQWPRRQHPICACSPPVRFLSLAARTFLPFISSALRPHSERAPGPHAKSAPYRLSRATHHSLNALDAGSKTRPTMWQRAHWAFERRWSNQAAFRLGVERHSGAMVPD